MLITTHNYIPLFTFLRAYSEDGSVQNLGSARELFLSDIPSCINQINNSITVNKVDIVTPPKDILNRLTSRMFASTKLCTYILIEADIEIDVDNLKLLNATKDIDTEFLSSVAVIFVSEAIEAILTITEIAYPGCINTKEGVSISNDIASSIREKNTFYSLFYPNDNDVLWPPLKQLELHACIKWAQQNGFSKQAFAHNRTSRALASLTHAISHGQHLGGEVLFRSMQGLEAFYCDGIGDLRKQLSEKSSLLLGPWNENSNIVGKLYDIRSKFVHGSSSIEYKNHHIDSWEENEKKSIENEYASNFAIRLLIGSIQKCVIDNIQNINWAYSYKING